MQYTSSKKARQTRVEIIRMYLLATLLHHVDTARVLLAHEAKQSSTYHQRVGLGLV